MLRIVEGQPGSGKTYYAVHYLSKYSEFDKLYNTYILQSDVLLITNIDDIKVKHVTVDEFLKYQLYKIDKFKEYMSKKNYKRSIIIVDEAQRYFSTDALKQHKDEVNDIYFFFEYHRHLGCDVFLIVQTVSALSKRLINLSEYIIRARQSTVSLPKVFLYDALDSVTGDRLFIVKLTKSNDVFKLYKSFEFEESVKRGSVLLRKWVIGLSLFAIPLLIAIFLLSSGYIFKTKSDVAKDTKKNSRVVYSQNNPYPDSQNNPYPDSQNSSNTLTQNSQNSSNTLTQNSQNSSNALTQNSQNSSNTLTQNSQNSSNTLTQNSQNSSNTLTQNSQNSSNTLNDVCIFASCDYPKLRRYYAKNDKEQIAGKVCYANSCYYYVQKYEEENKHVFARSEKSEQSSEQSDKKESLAVVPERERHEGKATTSEARR